MAVETYGTPDCWGSWGKTSIETLTEIEDRVRTNRFLLQNIRTDFLEIWDQPEFVGVIQQYARQPADFMPRVTPGEPAPTFTIG